MRSLLRRSLTSVVAHYYRFKPVTDWPKWAGDLLEVKIPANLTRKTASSPEGGSNINIILALLDRTRDVPGDVAECGVFRGGSLIAIALYLRENGLAKHVYGLDSFQGFDGSVQKDIELGGAEDGQKRVGGFEATSLAHVRAKLGGLRLLDTITLIPGYFADTLETLASASFSFVHLDCDIHDSYTQTLQYFYPRMSPGGIILFDEYNDPPWPGCNLAVDNFLAGKPEEPAYITMNNYQKFFIKKKTSS
jgi:O-methyltransferase